MPKKNISFGKKDKQIRTRIQIRECNGKEKNITSFTIFGIDGKTMEKEISAFLKEKFGILTKE